MEGWPTRLSFLCALGLLVGLPMPALSQGTYAREPGDTRAMSCTRNSASLIALSREFDAEAGNLKAEGNNDFTPSTRAFFENMCPRLRRHTALVDQDCDQPTQNEDIAKNFPRIEALIFARQTLPFCDQFFKPAAVQTPPQPAAPARGAARAQDETDVFVRNCVSGLRETLILQNDFQRVILEGKDFAVERNGKLTAQTMRYYERICPKVRNAGKFAEKDCMLAIGMAKVPIETDVLGDAETFTKVITGFCDKHFRPALMTSAEYQKQFDREVRRKRYPETVSAVCENGEPRFSAVFEPFPKGRFGFYAHHGASDEAFRRYEADYANDGFKQVWHNRLECGGRAYNQAVWKRQ